ncbi:MAG: hypothetical protein J6W13_14535 [Salinivirgaceae bacterium]|nr:hypothetical protein [Salinivirgaceae bacterium]
MAEDINNENNQEREIDLIDLMGRFFNWLGNAFVKLAILCKNAVLWVIKFVIRNWLLYACACILVVGMTFYKNTQPPYYDCSMRLECMCVNASYAINRVNSWNYKIGLSDDISKQIRHVDASYLLDYNGDGNADAAEEYSTQARKDTTSRYTRMRMAHTFDINIEIYIAKDSTILDSIRNAIMAYLYNDNWIQEQNILWQRESKNRISRLDKEIEILDSLQKKEYFTKEDKKFGAERDGSFLMISEKDKRLYHSDLINLTNSKLSIEHKLYDEPFKIIKDISIPVSPINTVARNAKHSFLYIMFFATIVIFIFDRRKWIKSLIQESKETKE